MLLLVLGLSACGRPVMKPFASPDLRSRSGLSIALLPFDNLTQDSRAGKTMENMVLVEFLKQVPSSVRFVDPGEVNAALVDERIRVTTAIPGTAVKALGDRLGADLLLQGVVQGFEMQRVTSASGAGDVPVVSLSLRMVDTKTGEIVWALSSSRRGNDQEKVFGIGRVDSLEQLSQEVVGEMAAAFAKSL